MNTIAQATLDALSFGMLLFLLSAGLTLTFGLMRILNMSHTSLFMIGGYIGLAAWTQTRNFWLAVVAGAVAMGLAGLVLYRLFLQRYSKEDELPQVLLTFGVLLVLADLALIVWGGDVKRIPAPELLQGAIDLGPIAYPKYRLFLIVTGLVMAVLLWRFVGRTRMGALVRAGVDDTETAQSLGINMPVMFLLVFGFGSLLAGMAGVLAAPYLGTYPGQDFETMLLAFAVIIVGGAGSIEGAFVAALLVALVDTMTKTFLPGFGYFSIYVPMALILAFRPYGLLGRSA